MKTLPVGISDFNKLRNKDLLYVDKTEHLYRMVTGAGYYFLSRPRRFGKSLLVSALKEIFLGNAAAFKGLWIEDKIEWEPHPVIHLSFSSLSTQAGEFQEALQRELHQIANEYALPIDAVSNKELVNKLVTGLSEKLGPVVILIDEYDKPILDRLHKMEVANENRLIIKEFFEGLKDLDAHIRFLFITGVTKFSKVSLFSGINNLADLTLSVPYSTICGYTQAELEHYFGEAFPALAADLGMDLPELEAQIKRLYNGYSWLGERVYNPWAIMNMLETRTLGNFWSGSGNPEFLLKKLHAGLNAHLDKLVVSSTLLESHSIENMDYRNLLFQAGYLTIHSHDVRTRTYTLGYPNEEVKDALLQLMYSEFAFKQDGDSIPSALDLSDAFRNKDMEQVIKIINSMFSSIPYHLFIADKEAYYHSILHIMFSLLGLFIRCEIPSAKGRTDMVVFMEERIYILEFKVGETPEDALAQIRRNGYAKPWLAAGKEIVLLGVAFGKEEKGVTGWKEEPL